jgi:hypothetical protein
MTSSSGSWKREFVMVEAQLALRVVAMGCQSRKSQAKSQESIGTKLRVVASTEGDATRPWPRAWRIAGRLPGLPAGAGWLAPPTMLGAKANPPQHCHNFFWDS